MAARRIFRSARFHRAILGSAALLVPGAEREEWFREWTSELWYLLGGNHRNAHFSDLYVVRFCLGSFKDALWMWRNGSNRTGNEPIRLRSPIRCVSLLVAVASITSLVALREAMLQPPYTGRAFLLGQLVLIAVALLILPSTTTFGLGEYPPTPHSPSWAARPRRWIFLLVKFALLVPIVFCGTLDFGLIIASTGVEPHAMLVGYILAFRWMLIDQRRRCPVCLEVLTGPVHIGQSSHTVLDWYGTELMCRKGHGLMHVPDTPTCSFSTQRWIYLDSSWRSLFS